MHSVSDIDSPEQEILTEIERIRNVLGRPIVVALDGGSGAGKSTRSNNRGHAMRYLVVALVLACNNPPDTENTTSATAQSPMTSNWQPDSIVAQTVREFSQLKPQTTRDEDPEGDILRIAFPATPKSEYFFEFYVDAVLPELTIQAQRTEDPDGFFFSVSFAANDFESSEAMVAHALSTLRQLLGNDTAMRVRVDGRKNWQIQCEFPGTSLPPISNPVEREIVPPSEQRERVFRAFAHPVLSK